ncbi:hypothetical protein LDENG_00188470 [Lucifuga dentata]|nr:hypothetical protein LDENG_00188470 [Lucifuga dentata]
MKLIPDSSPCLFLLLLLVQLFVYSASRPAHNHSLCSTFSPMINHLDSLSKLSKTLHGLTDHELITMATATNRLDALPNIQHSAAHFNSAQLNASLSELYVDTQAFRLHVDWLKTARKNVSLSSHPAELRSTHLHHLSKLLNNFLHQIHEEIPQPPSPSLPFASTTFDVLQYSIEISEKLKVFCFWSKRVLNHLKKLPPCA